MNNIKYFAIENGKIVESCIVEPNSINLIDFCLMVDKYNFFYKIDENLHKMYQLDKETAIKECNGYINACKREEYSNINLTYKDVLNDIKEQLK